MRVSMTGRTSAGSVVGCDTVAAGEDRPDPALGVFDTLLVRGGRTVELRVHVDRLARSVRELYGVPVDAAALASRMAAACEGTAGAPAARLRTAYRPSTDSWELEAAEIAEPGLDPRVLAVRRIAGGLGPHKWLDRRLVTDPDAADDVLVVDEQDRVLECGTANVFVVVKGVVVTPPLDGRILPGTVRGRVIGWLEGDGRGVRERDLSVGELTEASEVFTTSSVRGVQPVASCHDVGSWTAGVTVSWLRARLHDAGL